MTDPPASHLPCLVCRVEEAEADYAMPLCRACRDQLVRRPLPPLLRVSIIALLGVLAFAFVRSIGSFEAGVAFERGQRAERAKQYPAAVEQYDKVVAQFPKASVPLLRLAAASLRAGDRGECLHALERLEGRKMSRSQIEEFNGLVEQLRNEQRIKLMQPRPGG